jgi:putative transposase
MAPVYRTDLFSHAMNKGKEAKVRAVLTAWRKAAPLAAAEQWRLFFETGTFDYFLSGGTFYETARGTARGQDVRRQVVGILKSHIALVQSDFSRIVEKSSLKDDVRHHIHIINKCHAWFKREPMLLRDTKAEIPQATRALARAIMRHSLSLRRRPKLGQIGATLSQKLVSMSSAKHSAETSAKKPSSFPLWLKLSTLEKGKPVHIPLLANPRALERAGSRSKTVQLVQKNGEIYFGLVTEVTEAFETLKKSYVARTPELALDFGLRTLFATDKGDLLGRGFLDRLRAYDELFSALASYRQSHGLKVRSPRYDSYVSQMRAFIKNEVNRVLNQLVATHAPAHLVLERLNFQNPNLSSRMNRLVQNCGRAAIRTKLADLHDKYGITSEEVNPAYTSQECSSCGYVDKKNRARDTFKCLWCGKHLHADVNGARSINNRRGRSSSTPTVFTKEKALQEITTRFLERKDTKGPRSGATDPRLTNPYFQALAPRYAGNNGTSCVTLIQKEPEVSVMPAVNYETTSRYCQAERWNG